MVPFRELQTSWDGPVYHQLIFSVSMLLQIGITKVYSQSPVLKVNNSALSRKKDLDKKTLVVIYITTNTSNREATQDITLWMGFEIWIGIEKGMKALVKP